MKIDGIDWKMCPLEHQKRIVSSSLDVLYKYNFAAYFCEVGTRKTSMAITTAVNMAYKGMIRSIVVICPNSLFSGWINEFELHATLPEAPIRWDTINPKTIKSQKEIEKSLGGKFPVFIVNYDAFSRDNEFLEKLLGKFSANYSFIIMDESHKIKVPNSNRTAAIMKISNTFDYRMIMTGTEIPSGVSNIWSQFECLERGFWKNRAQIGNHTLFRAKFEIMGQFKLPNGVMKETPKKYKFMRDFEKIRYDKGLKEIYSIIEPFTFRAKRDECYDLPDSEVKYIDFDLSKEERKVYDDMKNQLMSEVNGRILAINNPVALFMRFRQISRGFIGETIEDNESVTKNIHEITSCPGALTALREHVDDHDENEIFFCSFTHDVDMVANELEKFGSVVRMYGKQSQAENQAAKMAFERGEARFIVGNMRMLAAGHNFQTHCSMTAVFSPDTDNEAWGQHEGRVNRSGQTRKMQFFRFRAKNTIDRRMYDILEGNLNVQYNFARLTLGELLEIS